MESSKELHLFETEITYIIINVNDLMQFNASMLNKSIKVKTNRTDPKHSNVAV